ncbi:MAG: hypothetical protein BGO49_05595 [Planctomycetales bacterium 71-10]|nr:MAG: hypothetical protein BGO49_05595 [Planctomycetales bacterium 71-10]
MIRLYPPALFLWVLRLHARLRGSVDFELFTAFFLFNSGLDRCDLRDRGAVAKQLRRRLRRTSPDVATTYVAQFSGLLHRRGAPWASLLLIESFFGIDSCDYPGKRQAGASALREKIQKRLDGVEFPDACMLMMQFINSCIHIEGRGGYAAYAVVEAFFEVSSEDFDPDRLSEKLGPRLAGLDDVPTVMLIQGLAIWLIGIGRKAEAQMLYRWFFDLGPSDLANASKLASRVRERAAEFRPEAFSLMVHSVPVVLHPVLGRDTVIRLVEDLYGVTPDLYRDPRQLAERFHLGSGSDLSLATAIALTEALQYSRQFERSQAVLQALLSDGGDVPRDTQDLLGRLPAFVERLEAYQKPAFHKLVMDNLFRSGQLHSASRYLEGLLRITAADYSSGAERLAARIRQATIGFAPEEDTILVGQLFGTLVDTSGREGDALLLLEAFLWSVLDLSRLSVTRPSAAEGVCHLLRFWLELSPPDRAFSRCGAIVGFLRDCLDLRGVLLEDRSRFIQDLATLRRLIVQIGWEHAGSDEGLYVDVLCWDVELGQRLLLERYRYLDGDGAALSAGPTRAEADGLKRGWSLGRPRPSLENGDGEGADDASPFRVPFCFGFRRATSDEPDPRAGSDPVEPSKRFLEVQRLLEGGVTPEGIADAIGPRAILLRAGFHSSGHLYWNAFRTDGSSVSRIAGALSTSDTARVEVAGAVAWHDRCLAAIWAENGRREQPLRAFARATRLPVREVVRRLAPTRGVRPPDPGSMARLSAQILDACSRCYDESWLAEWIGDAIPTDWEAALADQRASLRRVWERLASILEAIGGGNLEQSLDLVTEVFLERVAMHLDLRPLEPLLGGQVDLVVEVEGPLHSVPVALVGIGPRRLFECVRSSRTSLSLLIDLLQSCGAVCPAGSGSPERLLTVSWFEEDDPAFAGAVCLHRGQELLADRFNLTWESASDSPPGGSAAIRGALTRGPAVRLLTVCGHGRLHGPGVQLKDEAWTGRGCDFERVGWLLLVSCSLGRVRHGAGDSDEGDESEVPDVEGFVANLVARRVRSVLACRWPVHGALASRFANLVSGEYLAGAETGTRSSGRACALNRARARVLGRCRTNSINTVAAFEIYGQG